MTVTNDHAATTTRRAESVVTTALENWKNGLNAVTAPFQAVPTVGAFPQFDVAEAIERQIKVIQQLIDVNAGYARQLAEATNTVTGAVRAHIEGLNTVMVQQVTSVSELTQSNVETLEESVQETADQAERIQREARERAAKVEREQRQLAQKAAREQRQQTRERYRSLNKNELSDEAAKRNLPKTGTIDELVERLVEHDLSQ